jgi:glycosyltransferase involved in cell wall biosynthesis
LKITLFVPVINEIDGLKRMMPLIARDLFHQILIVDGQSGDGSAEWSRENGFDVYVQQERGLHHAYREAWSSIKGDYVLSFSPDGNCKIEDLPLLIAKIKEGFDMVIASRYFLDAKSEDDSALTSFGNWLFTKTINVLHGGNYTDAMTIFRIYRTNLMQQLNLDDPRAYKTEKWFFTKIGVEPLLSVRAAKAKLKVAEIPSDEPKRFTGERKLQVVRWGLAYMAQVIREKFI